MIKRIISNAVYIFSVDTIESAQKQGGFYMSRKRKQKLIFSLTIGLTIIICVAYMIMFITTHFLSNTIIGSVDCSYLTIDEAIEKVKQQTKKSVCNFYFNDDIVEHPTYEEAGMKLDKEKFKKLLNEQHMHFFSAREYNINLVSYFEKETLREYFKQLPEMQAENMIEPKNARIVWDGKNFSIEPETMGKQIDAEAVVNFAILQLSNGMGNVYFSIITNSKPDIVTEDLKSRKDYLNTILKSYLRFKLSDGEVIVLGKRTIKNWIKEDEKYGYIVDVEEGVKKFIAMLSDRVEKASQKSNKNEKLDTQAEEEAIYEALEQTGQVDVEMFYIK